MRKKGTWMDIWCYIYVPFLRIDLLKFFYDFAYLFNVAGSVFVIIRQRFHTVAYFAQYIASIFQ